MDIALIKTALGLEADSTDVAVLERIQEIRAAAGDSEYSKEDPTITLIRAGQHEQCCLNADGSITLTLDTPITLGKDEISEMTFRRPKLKDIRLAQEGGKKTELQENVALAVSLTGTTPKIIDDLDLQDAAMMVKILGFFQMRGRRQTGANS